MSDISLSASSQREYFHVISIESVLVGPRVVEWRWGYQGLAAGGKRHRAAVWKNDTSGEAGDDEKERVDI